MHAILGIDLEARAGTLLYHFIDARRAITLRRLRIFGQIDRNGNGRIAQQQMNWLIFLMIGARKKHTGQPIEG